MDIVKDIASIFGCIISLITLITLCSKGGRAFIKGLFARNTKELQEENEQQFRDIQEIKETLNQVLIKMGGLEEISMQQCRNTIKNIYYKYNQEKKIPLYERKTADNTFRIYTEVFHGNSYAALLYKEICKWEIDSSEHGLEE